MLSYGDEKTFTWKHGRELSQMTDDSGTWSFEYNADGLRVYRSNGTTEYKYYYNGDKLTRMVVNGQNITFGYDANGAPQYVIYGGHRYFYLTNLQGDVVAIVTTSGETVVEYSYDAWGNILATTGTMAATLGKDNPLRYRGYVYDEETELYYLQSRYYDPALGRFINADVYTSTGQGFVGNNMFAYCGNNPVVNKDSAGTAVETVFDIISLGASIAEVAVNPADPWAWVGLIGDAADVALPCVAGLGEAVRALKSVGALDDSIDMAQITKNTLNAISTAAQVASGGHAVYTADISGKKGILEYVGITNDFGRRESEWKNIRTINEYINGVDRDTARYAEQTVITLFGKNGNSLSNIRNSIGVKGKLYTGYLEFFQQFF